MFVERVKRKKDICLMVQLFANAFQRQFFFLNAKIFYQNYFSMTNNYESKFYSYTYDLQENTL